MFKTHFLFALFLSLLTINYFGLSPIFYILILLFAGSLPDIDHYKSKIGRKLFIISFLINFIFGHRKLIHSVIFATILAIVIRVFFGLYWIPFYIGYLSHLFLDSLTKQGVYLFYPSNFRIHGFIKTNGIIEKVFLVFLLVLNTVFITKYIL